MMLPMLITHTHMFPQKNYSKLLHSFILLNNFVGPWLSFPKWTLCLWSIIYDHIYNMCHNNSVTELICPHNASKLLLWLIVCRRSESSVPTSHDTLQLLPSALTVIPWDAMWRVHVEYPERSWSSHSSQQLAPYGRCEWDHLGPCSLTSTSLERKCLRN